jgi:hypothetical protein
MRITAPRRPSTGVACGINATGPVNELIRFAMVAFFPRVDDLPGLAELGVEEKIARLRRESTLLFWTGIVGATVFFHLSPILTVRRPWLASALTEDELDTHTYKLATHPSYLVRQLVLLLKLIAGIFWGESPEIRAFVHLPPYPADPGTRRIEAQVLPQVLRPRAPAAQLVQLGRREEERGRGRRRRAGPRGSSHGPG